MRLTPGLRRTLAVVLTAAAFPAFAIASRALAPGGEAGLRQRSPTLRLQPILTRLGLKSAGSAPVELRAGEKVRATVVDPRKLATFGIRGARVGDVAWVSARLPQAQAGDQAAAATQAKQAEQAATGAAGGLDAAVSVETTDASGQKKNQTTTVPAAPGPGQPTTAD